MLELPLAGGRILLLAQRAAYLPEHRTLLVADAHFGKARSFRRQGLPVPRGTTAGNLQRLSQALAATGAQRLVFLGDFLHSAQAQAAGLHQALAEWKARHAALHWCLVRGNHDAHAGDPPAALGLEVVNEPWPLGGLALCHHPQVVAGAYALAGHLHPCVRLREPVGPGLRLPCFWFGPETGVLPAFGEFTGMQVVPAMPGHRRYVVAGDEVRALPQA